MKHNKKLEQRTFLQDRFEILIKKQKTGKASFNELTELDEIVNKHAAFRERILEEMHVSDGPPNNPASEDLLLEVKKQPVNLLSVIKSFVGRLFILRSNVSAPSPHFKRACLSF
ncbi:MAG TPA: hypothetical protein VGN20_27220 [Mucilaginibacter sp.]|jgi:hypothetical protein